MKFSMRGFLRGAAGVEQGLVEGKARGDALRQQDEATRLATGLHLFQLGRQQEEGDLDREDQLDQGMLHNLPLLDEGSRAQVLQTVMQRRAERAQRPRQFDLSRLGGLVPKGHAYDQLRTAFPGAGAAAPPAQVGAQAAPGAPVPPGAPAQPGQVNVPGYPALTLTDPTLDAPYDKAIASHQARLLDQGPNAVRNPGQRTTLEGALAKLRAGKKSRTPIDKLGYGPEGLALLAPQPADPKQVALSAAGVEKTIGDLNKVSQQLPTDSPARKYIADLISAAPRRYSDDQDPQEFFSKVDRWRDQAGYYQGLAGLGAQGLEDKQLHDDTGAFQTRLGNLDTLDDDAFANELPQLFDVEKDLRKRYGPRGTVPQRLGTHAEDIEALRTALSNGDKVGAGEIAQELRGRLGSRITPEKQTAALSAVMRMIGELPESQQNNPEIVKSIFQNSGLGYLLQGLPGEALHLGGARADKIWRDLVDPAKLAAVAKLDKKGQSLYLNELIGAAHLAGKNLEIPAEILLKAGPEEALKLQTMQERLKILGTHEQRESAKWNLDKQVLQAKVDAAKSGKLYGGKGAAGKSGWTAGDSAQARSLQHEADQAATEYGKFFQGRGGFGPGDFDPDALLKDPKALSAQPQDVQLAVRKWGEVKAKREAVRAFLRQHAGPTTTPAPGAAKDGLGQVRANIQQKGLDLSKARPEGVAAALKSQYPTLTDQQLLDKANALLKGTSNASPPTHP